MSIRKKLTLGAMSATLGISLIAGGTFAAFNDIERVTAGVAAGELKLDVREWAGKPYTFEVSNLKPGDTMTRELNMVNVGTLAIKDVLMAVESVEFTDYLPQEGEPGYSAGAGANTAIEYLDQFRVSVVAVGAEGGSGGFPKNIISPSANVTLADFYLASDSILGNAEKLSNGATQAAINAARAKVWNSVDQTYLDDYRMNVATINPDQWTGLPIVPHDPDRVRITIEFIDNEEKTDDGLYVQNVFQGDSANITISLEARQWGGLDVQDSDLDSNGYIKTNERANSEAGNPRRP